MQYLNLIIVSILVPFLAHSRHPFRIGLFFLFFSTFVGKCSGLINIGTFDGVFDFNESKLWMTDKR